MHMDPWRVLVIPLACGLLLAGWFHLSQISKAGSDLVSYRCVAESGSGCFLFAFEVEETRVYLPLVLR